MKDLKTQYKNELNLQKRIQIHQFGTAKESWFEFLAKNITFPDNSSVLEIGCGTGLLWKSLLQKSPNIKKLIISDFSQGMLEKSKETLSEFEQDYDIEYKRLDVTDITFGSNSFDVVIANHVLYHVSDISKALSEISRVLNNGGLFFATTIGKDNMSELKLIINKYFPTVENNIFFNQFLENFSLENAILKTENFFKTSFRVDFNDNLLIPNPSPIREYIESFEFPLILDNEEKKLTFEKELHKDYNFREGFKISKEIGLIKCQK